MSKKCPTSLYRLRFVVRYEGKQACKICEDRIYIGQSAIKIKIPNQVADKAGWISYSCPKAREKLFYEHGPWRGCQKYTFHWHCYRDWEFRLDKTHDRIVPEPTNAERDEKNKAMGRERGYFSEGMRLMGWEDERP